MFRGLYFSPCQQRKLAGMAVLSLALMLLGTIARGADNKPDDGATVDQLKQEARDAARRAYEEAEISWEAGVVKTDFVWQHSHRWMEQELELAKTGPEKAAAVEAHIERIKRLQKGEAVFIGDLEYYFAEADLTLAKVHPSPELKTAAADRKALEGIWRVVSVEAGDPVEKDRAPKSLTFAGRRLNFDEQHSNLLFTLDAGQTPKRMDEFRSCGDIAFGFSAIYKIAGDDLTILMNMDVVGRAPLKEFSVKEKADVLLVLRREKPKAAESK